MTCLILFDLCDVDKRYLNDDDFVQKRKMDNPYDFPTNDEQIKSDTTIFRVLNADEGFSGTNTSYFFHSLGGYHGAKLSKYQNRTERTTHKLFFSRKFIYQLASSD